jgi:hypothetical protein
MKEDETVFRLHLYAHGGVEWAFWLLEVHESRLNGDWELLNLCHFQEEQTMSPEQINFKVKGRISSSSSYGSTAHF